MVSQTPVSVLKTSSSPHQPLVVAPSVLLWLRGGKRAFGPSESGFLLQSATSRRGLGSGGDLVNL